MEVKVIPVACAIIERDGLVLCAQRSSSMSLPLKWEFPGGKLEPNEQPSEALIREIEEELGVTIQVLQELPVSKHAYVPEKEIHLLPYLCHLPTGESPIAREHAQLQWIKKEELNKLDWAEADIPILNYYMNQL